MPFQPKLQNYQYDIKTIDSHTMGEPTRIIYAGFPELRGNTVMEKKQDLIANWDHLRTALMMEPRGHRDMFGALLVQPISPEADLGVIFMDCGGCLNMCGHGSIGVCAMSVETGLVKVTEPYTNVTLETPSGLIHAKVLVENGRAREVSFENVPAFMYLENQEITISGGRKIPFDIVFGGSFFALVDADAMGLVLEPENGTELAELGMEIRREINRTVHVQHPNLDITTVDLVEFYTEHAAPGADIRNCVVFGDEQVDRSPCGTGTSAKLAALYAKGKLALGHEIVCEGITGSRFKGAALRETSCGPYRAITPKITGRAYITGLNRWVFPEDDPLRSGFLLGDNP